LVVEFVFKLIPLNNLHFFYVHSIFEVNQKNTTMKTLKLLAMILIIGALAASCEKEEGPTGPQGPAGAAGANGNANVMVYGFGETTLTSVSTEKSFTLPISSGKVDSSMIYPYFHHNSWWYPAGSIGYASSYLTRYYIFPGTTSSSLLIGIKNVDGSVYTGADVTWDSVRVFVIPANVFKIAKNQNVDFNDYQAVADYCESK